MRTEKELAEMLGAAYRAAKAVAEHIDHCRAMTDIVLQGRETAQVLELRKIHLEGACKDLDALQMFLQLVTPQKPQGSA